MFVFYDLLLEQGLGAHVLKLYMLLYSVCGASNRDNKKIKSNFLSIEYNSVGLENYLVKKTKTSLDVLTFSSTDKTLLG